MSDSFLPYIGVAVALCLSVFGVCLALGVAVPVALSFGFCGASVYFVILNLIWSSR